MLVAYMCSRYGPDWYSRYGPDVYLNDTNTQNKKIVSEYDQEIPQSQTLPASGKFDLNLC